jgi:hypothetical protein
MVGSVTMVGTPYLELPVTICRERPPWRSQPQAKGGIPSCLRR